MSGPGEDVIVWRDAPARVRTAITTRRWAGHWCAGHADSNAGKERGSAEDEIDRDHRSPGSVLQLPSEPFWLRQVHGNAVIDADAPAPGVAPAADAIVTRRAGIVLVIRTADCLPLLLASDAADEIAGIHAGWRGLAAGVVESTVRAMQTPRHQLRAFLGPAAGPRAYEVGEEVRAAFVEQDSGAAAAFVATRPGHWLCDLYALARQRLASRGIDRVDGGDRCTITEADAFFSYRRDRDTRRMLSLIWIDPERPVTS
jgi:YfiH family protein